MVTAIHETELFDAASSDVLILSRGEALLFQGKWAELETYADGLLASRPHLANWLKAYLAIEKSRIPEAAQLIDSIVPQALPASRLAEIQARLALLHSHAAQETLLAASDNPGLPFALRARCALTLDSKKAGARLLAKALREKEPPAEAYWLAGLFAAQKQAKEKALRRWGKALELRPVFAACLYDRGRFRVLWGDAGGELDCQQALTIKPWAGTIAVFLAKHYVNQKLFLKAVKVLDQSLIAQEDQPDVVAALIDILRLQGENKAAFMVSDKALAKYPLHGGILLSYGTLLQQNGQREKALAVYERAKQTPALSAAAASNKAALLLYEGDSETAIAEWEEALTLEPGNQHIACNLGHAFLQRGDTDRAYEQFQSVLARHPHNADALRGMAHCCLADENEKPALEYASRALERGKHDARNYLTLSKVLSFSGNKDEAIVALQRGLPLIEKPVVLHEAIVTALITRNDFDLALATAEKAREQAPTEYEYYSMCGEALLNLNRFAECEKVLQQSKQVAPERGGAALVRFYQSRNRYEDARREAEELLGLAPQTLRYYGLLGEVLYRMELYDEAKEVLRRGREIDPARVSINRQLAGQLMARECYDEALAIARDFMQQAAKAPQYQLLIEVLRRSRRFDEAYQHAENFFSAEAGNVTAALTLARAAERVKKYERALEVLQSSLVHNPENILLHNDYVALLCRLERYEEARAHAYGLLRSKQDKAPQIIELAIRALIEANELDEALKFLNRYIDHLKAPRRLWSIKYLLLRRMERKGEAEQHLLSTIARFSGTDHSFKWVIGELIKSRNIDKALALTQTWIQKRPSCWDANLAELHIAEIQRDTDRIQQLADSMVVKWSASAFILSRLAQAYRENWLLIKSLTYARQAMELRPDSLDYLSGLLLTLTKAGDYEEFDELVRKMEKLMGDRRYHGYLNWFFVINSHPEWSAEKIFQYQKTWGKYAITPNLPPEKQHRNTPEPFRRLRIGYVSPDFRRHAVAYFSEPLLIEHEREDFELFAFAHFEPDQQDAITERYKGYFHHWIDISTFSDDEFLRKVRENKIDILVDLAGHTKGSRLIAMALKPAPIQVSYALGAGQTTGLEQIDYFIAEKNHVPDWFEQYCSEKVIRQQWQGYPYMPDKDAGEVSVAPFHEKGFITFGSVSRPIRIGNKILRVWAKLLNALPDARLQLDHVPYAEPEMQDLIRNRFIACGGNPQQLIFANTRPYWDFYKQVDIMLDTFPAGSGTTATDSLWMGVPVVTVASRPLMGLFATIQLKALGLDQYCVAADEEGYLAQAIRLATDRELLNGIRMGLRECFLKSSLMDYKGYAKDIARIYREIWVKWCERQQIEKGSDR